MQPSSYTRENHFRETLKHIQGKHNLYISDYNLGIIRNECGNNISYNSIKLALKKSMLMNHCEEIPKIYEILSGNTIIKISDEDEKRIIKLFTQVSNNYNLVIMNSQYSSRVNFLNYNFIIKKIAEELNILIPEISILKSLGKLEQNEKIWNKVYAKVRFTLAHEILENYFCNLLYKRNLAITIFQTQIRQILAQRHLQRLKIKRELEYLPGIGIEYQKALKNFNKNFNKNI